MNLLILNGPRSPRAAAYPGYRGTFRAHPTHHDDLPEDHELNVLFHWFLEEGGETGLVHDLNKALRYTEQLNRNPLAGRSNFEVVEVTDGHNDHKASNQLLGFDLSAGYNNSLLWWKLDPGVGINTLPEAIRELASLINRRYGPRLNRHSLFQTPDIASECLRAMDALQQLCPNLYEGESLKDNFHVTGVYLIS